MPWSDDTYVRRLLDGREKWGTVLSLTAIAGLLVFLAEHEHKDWVKLAPTMVGFVGTWYLLVVNCYYKQAEAIAEASETRDSDLEDEPKKAQWLQFFSKIGFLGWFQLLIPLFVGMLATLVLYFGTIPKRLCPTCGQAAIVKPKSETASTGELSH
jgi:hypothetical protein